jgi:hypothetical protein
MRGVPRGRRADRAEVGDIRGDNVRRVARALDPAGRVAASHQELTGWKLENAAKLLALRRFMPWEADRILAWLCYRSHHVNSFRFRQAKEQYERAYYRLTAYPWQEVRWKEWDGHQWVERADNWQ